MHDQEEAALLEAWETYWDGLTPEQQQAELAAMDAYASDPNRTL